MDCSTTGRKGLILAHRGLWTQGASPNSSEAVEIAIAGGFGLEIDLRDNSGELVVAHDIPNVPYTKFEEVLAIFKENSFPGILALNVKSDGLIQLISEFQETLRAIDHFFFDMSFPEARRYSEAGHLIARRRSEFENSSFGFSAGNGIEDSNVWVDSFETDWWINLAADDIAPAHSRCFFVSPELHGRNPENAWHRIRELYMEGRQIGICTDWPEAFRNFLEGKS